MGDAESPDAAVVPARRRRDIRERMAVGQIDDFCKLTDSDLAVFTIVRPDGEPFFEFDSGQYVQLAFWDQPVEDPRPRQYSIASSPLDRGHLEIYVVLVRDEISDESERFGVFTRTLWGHQPGDEILYLPRPAGRFLASRTSQQDLVCVATGTGLAPFISMARKFWRSYQQTGRVERRLTIIHGVSRASQLGYNDLLREMALDTNFGLLYVPVVSRVQRESGATPEFSYGRANDLVRYVFGEPKLGEVDPWSPPAVKAELQRRLVVGGSAVYLCGNPGMISDVRDLLERHSFVTEGRDAQVITEDYW